MKLYSKVEHVIYVVPNSTLRVPKLDTPMTVGDWFFSLSMTMGLSYFFVRIWAGV